MAVINLPAVDSDVNVFVTAMNASGSGPARNIAVEKISELHTARMCMFITTYVCIIIIHAMASY